VGKGDGSPIHLAGSLPNYVAGWAKERAVLDRNLGMIRSVSHTLIAAIGDDCLPYGTGEGHGEHEGNDGEGGQ